MFGEDLGMNKIYRVIWSKVKNCYVVVSEIVKTHSKGGSTVRRVPAVGTVLITMLMASVMNLGISAPVWAAGSATVTGTTGTDALATIQAGEGIAVTEEGNIIKISTDNTLSLLNRYVLFSPDYGQSAADSPSVDDRSISSFAVGKKSQISVIPGENTTSENNMAIGSNAKIFAGEAGTSKGSNTAIGAGAATGVIVDYDTGKIIYTTFSTAVGSQARVYGNQSVSIGQNAQVGYKKEILLNTEGTTPVYAIANDAIAIGSGTTTWSNQSTAIGASAKAGKQYSGNSVSDQGKAEPYTTSKATAVGYKAVAENLSTTAIGAESKATGSKSAALGSGANASGLNSAAIGSGANASGSSSTAIGTSAAASKTNSTAIGSNAKATGENSSAIGALTVATGIQNVAMGEGSEARKDETISIGFHSIAANAEDISVGHDTVTFGDGSLAMGHMAFTGMPVKEKTGTEKQEKKFIELPTGSTIRETTILYLQTSDGTVLEYNGKTDKYYKVEAVPDGTAGWKFERVKVNGNDVEYLAKESKDKDVRTTGSKVNHIDYYYAKGENPETAATKTYPLDGGIAIGSYTVAQGERSMALGLTSAAYGKNSIAQGLYAAAYGEGAIAFGHETVSGAHVIIKPNGNIEDAHTTEFTVSPAGITDRTLVDGTVVGVDKNSIYNPYQNVEGKPQVRVNSIGTILTVDGETFGFDSNNIKLASSTEVSVKRDAATGYYYYTKDDKNYLVEPNEELVFTGSGGKTVIIPAGKMTLSAGGISFGSYSHAEGDRSMALGRAAGAYNRNSSAIGLFANAYGEGSTAIGHNASAGVEVVNEDLGNGYHASYMKLDSNGNGIRTRLEDGTPTQGGIAIGSYAHAEGDRAISVGRASGAYGKNSTAFGLYANALGEGAMAVGHGTATGTKIVISRTDPDDTDSHVINIDKNYLDGDNNPILLDGVRGGIAIGSFAHAEGDRAISVGRVAGAYGKNSTAFGLYANALGEGAMAIGHNASAGAEVIVSSPAADVHTAVVKLDGGDSGNPIATGGNGGIAIGSYAHATGNRAVSIGRASGAYSENSTAMGIYSNAVGLGSIAFGHGSSTGVRVTVNEGGADDFWTTTLNTDSTTGNPVSNGNDGGIAIGSYAHTEGTRALAVGRVSGAYGTDSTVVGLRSNAYGEGSIAFGHGVVAGDENDKYAVQVAAVHNNPTIDYDLDGKDNIAVNPAEVIGAVAIGSYAEATGRGSLSVGRYSKAKSAYSTTLGIRADVEKSAENAIAIGREAEVGALSGRNYDGLNSIAIGTMSSVKGRNSIAIGMADMLASDGSSIVPENARQATTVSGDTSIAIGMNDIVVGNSSIAIGTGHTVRGDNSGAIGDPNVVVGDSSYILGNSSQIGSVATKATETEPAKEEIQVKNAFIIGNNSKIASAEAEGGLIFGSGAEVTVRDGVALGNFSVADRAAAENVGYDPSGTDHSGDTSGVWISTSGAVSVGGTVTMDDGEGGTSEQIVTRQITNVAAGYEDTDAVNVAQLKQVAASASGVLEFGGDNTTPDTNVITRAFGQRLDIKGGADREHLTNSNIAVISNGEDTLEIKLSENVDLTSAGSMKIGNTKIEDAGITIQPASGSVLTRFTNNGISAGGQKIENVAAGVKGDDAVNVSQLKEARAELQEGTNTVLEKTLDQTDKHTIYKVNAYKTIVQKKAGDGNVVDISKTDSQDGLTITYDVSVADMHVKEGTASYGNVTGGTAADGTITLTHKDGTTATVTGLKNTYTTAGSFDATTKKATFTRNDGESYNLDLSAVSASDYTVEEQTKKVDADGKVTLKVSDRMNPKETYDVVIEDLATKTQQDINTENISTNTTNITNIRTDLDAGWNAKDALGNAINVNPENNDLIFAAADDHVTVIAEAGSRSIKIGVKGLVDTSLSNITEEGEEVITNIARDAITVEGEGGIEVTPSDDKSKYTVKSKLADNLTLREGNIDLANVVKIGNGTDVHTVTIDGTIGEITGLTNTTWSKDGVYNAGRAATEEQLQDLYEAAKGDAVNSVKLKFQGENTGTTLVRGNDEVLQIVGDGENITVKGENDKLNVQLSKDLNVNSITAGDTVINTDGVTADKVTVGDTVIEDKKITMGDTVITDSSVTSREVKAGDTIINDNGVTTNQVTVGDTTINNNGLTIVDGPSITIDGVDAGSKKIINVAEGTEKTDAVNLGQLEAAVAASKTVVEGGTNIASVEEDTGEEGQSIYTVNADGASVSAGSDALKVTKGEKDKETNITNYEVDLSDATKATLDKAENEGLTFAGDTGTSDKIKLGDTLNLRGGATSTLSDGNIGVEAEGDTLNIKLAKDIKDVDSIQVNKTVKVGDNVTLDGDGLTITNGPSITKDGVNAGGKRITNIADGEEDSDAASVGQLRDLAENTGTAITNVSNQISRVDSRMKKGLAGAAALAALHPLDFDPDSKLTFAAGVGNYRGANAAAVGAFYRPDERVMFSMGGTFGNDENMVNAGVSFALDRVNRISNTRTAMAHEIVELKDHIAKQDEQIAKLTALVNKLVGPEQAVNNPSMFPDVPENHWAYEYVADLQRRGALEGYPNGLFQGDRTMTRYEFAAMLDRALQKGIKLDERAAKEFEPELGRIYVQRISGDDNSRYKIERTRVNNHDKATRDMYGSKIVTAASPKVSSK